MKQKIRGLVWNVAGLWRKEEDFWEFLKDYEVIGLTETWVDEAGWGKLYEKLPRGWKWKCQHAKRESKKGRARGGIITGVRCEIEEREIGYEEKDGIRKRPGHRQRKVEILNYIQ